MPANQATVRLSVHHLPYFLRKGVSITAPDGSLLLVAEGIPYDALLTGAELSAEDGTLTLIYATESGWKPSETSWAPSSISAAE